MSTIALKIFGKFQNERIYEFYMACFSAQYDKNLLFCFPCCLVCDSSLVQYIRVVHVTLPLATWKHLGYVTCSTLVQGCGCHTFRHTKEKVMVHLFHENVNILELVRKEKI